MVVGQKKKEEDLLSLTPEDTGGEEGLLSLTSPQMSVPVGEDVARQRAMKAHVGLGEKSPGLDALANGIMNGQEDSYRSQAAADRGIQFRNDKLQLLADLSKDREGPLSQEEKEFVLGLSEVDFTENLDTIWETEYGQAFMTKLTSMDSELVSEAMREDPDGALDAMDAGSYVLARKEIAQKLAEDYQAQVQASGWGEYLADFAGNIIPILPWYRTQNAVKEAPTTSLLPGSNIEEQIEYLYTLPPSEFRKQLKAAVDDIGTKNKQTALQFAQYATSFATSDRLLNNVIGLADIADVATLGGLSVYKAGGRGIANAARAGARGAQGLAEGVIEGAQRGAQSLRSSEGTTRIQSFKQALRDTLKGAEGPKADAGDILTSAGKIPEAARVNAVRELRTLYRQQDPLLEGGQLFRNLPSISNPESLATGAKNLSREATQRLVAQLTRNAENVVRSIVGVSKSERLSIEALEVAMEQAENELKRRFTHVNDAILDVLTSRIRPDQTASGTGAVTIRLGTPDGNLFKSPEAATFVAMETYKLPEKSFLIKQQGTGYSVDVSKHIDETSDAVRGALIGTNNQSQVGMVNEWIGFLRTPEEVLSPLQRQNRHAITHGATEVQRLMKEMAGSIGKITGKRKERLERLLKANRDYVDEATGDRGMFFNSVGDFDDAYFAMHGIVPSEQETAAYFAFRQLSDMDYMFRNLGLTRDKARQGIERVGYTYHVRDDQGFMVSNEVVPFDGKRVDTIPWDNPEDAGIWVETLNTLFKKSEVASGDQRAILDKMVKEQGYEIIQVANPAGKPLAYRTGSQETVNFVLTRSPRFSKLDASQLPYKPGGHVEYASDFYVKQPKITRTGDESNPSSHIYEGDVSVFGFRTQAEATKYAKAMDEARILLREGREDELKAFLPKNLPFSVEDFKAMFNPRRVETPEGRMIEEPPFLNLNDRISTTTAGRNVSDVDVKMHERYSNFKNDIRSSYNLYANIDKKFAGERNGPLKTVTEGIGNENNPIFKLENAPTIDPFASLERTTANVMRNRFLTDYKIGAVESWMSEFGDLLQVSKTQQGRADLKNDPIFHLHNAVFDTTHPDTARLAAAQNTRSAILNLVGTPNQVEKKLRTMQSKIMDSIYNKGGQKAAEFTQEHLLSAEVNPAKFARSVAFHSKLGLFVPHYMFVNAQSLTHVLAIAGPMNGLPSMAASTLMQYLRINAKPQMIEAMANKAAKLGYKREHFIESFDEMKKTGVWNIEGETAWKDAIDYKLTSGAGGKFLDWGATIFKETERLIRLSSWNTAFLEFRKANPNVAITNRIRNEILARSNLLSVNMTRASNANWQNGLLSIPTQFWSYQMRLTEQLTGSRLTTTERLRAAATYGFMYGVPVAAGAHLGIFPAYDMVRTHALENGWDLDNNAIHAILEGIPSLGIKMAMGESYNFASRMGPGGLPVIADIYGDKTTMELLLGASGSIIGDILKASDPFLKKITGIFDEGQEEFPLKANDFIDVLRNISSVNQATKTLFALNTGRFITKNEIYLGDVEPWEAIFSGITGLTTSGINDAFLMNQSLKDLTDAQRQAEVFVIQNMRRAFQSMADGDEKSFDQYMKRAKVYLVAGGFQPDQYSRIFSSAAGGNVSLVEQARSKFLMRAPAGQFQQRLDQQLNQQQQANQ